MIITPVSKNLNGEFSEIISQTYFITTDDLAKFQDLTIISIASNPENFFDESFGIYVAGTNGEISQSKLILDRKVKNGKEKYL